VWVRGGFASGVVVVAEAFSAETGAAATAAVGEDVAALVTFGCLGLLLDVGVHGASPGVLFVQSLQRKRVESGLANELVSELAGQRFVVFNVPDFPLFLG
jgi:hypothetical protein